MINNKCKHMRILIFLLCTMSLNAQWTEALTLHNQVRSYYDLSPLSHDDNLANLAREHAENMAATGEFKVSKDEYGENIYKINKEWAQLKKTNIYLDATICWIVNMNEDERMITQIIFPEVSGIGFGMAENDSLIYAVAKYDKYYK